MTTPREPTLTGMPWDGLGVGRDLPGAKRSMSEWLQMEPTSHNFARLIKMVGSRQYPSRVCLLW